ncbi:2-C-methyl-D-erythritol 4-phosphate cytidylyltransferase [Halocynthiibacter styelae]|uniref:Bifunctional enzyme IspD/IspF n=1 Tax=Halocynthiibacter styelae TaxID=2761955 RepID=A0A8J7IVD0_9RHOB|nr:2-C-methyl-D-erythritol 4-phosphate cytidylyltransferase [Paenihalocynthiibacter styelae]MBI1492220.1 2-C-methyl-D-erythritol 4-phosphate cytidylyltransferase [Paenihalocynthiibacter styelae]
MQQKKTAAIVVSAGAGTRAAAYGDPDTPKQYHRLAGRLVVEHCLEKFATHPEIDLIVLVIRPQDREFVQKNIALPDGVQVILQDGGAERDLSVKAGLATIPENFHLVLIHDAARPLVSHALISEVLTALRDHQGAAPALPVTDALWRGADGTVQDTVSRENLWRAQTPQGFHLSFIRSAHARATARAADDVEIARLAGADVRIVTGSENNIKITHPADFSRAEQLLKEEAEQTMDIRTGNGFDVHKFGQREDGANDYVVLCGTRVPHSQGLLGHSDADVGMHAISDAIYGALSEGDIGRHFPPSEAQWKDADSQIFLKHAVGLARNRGFSISNIDCTLICEFPKIGPVAGAMQNRLSEITGIAADRISVKATTSEKLGFTGRGEGIAALVTTTLISQ